MFKLILISLFMLFIALPITVSAYDDINLGTHIEKIITLSNGKLLAIFEPKGTITDILVHFHGYWEDTLDSNGMAAIKNAINKYNYAHTAVIFPVNGITTEGTSVVNQTVSYVVNEYNNFLKRKNIKNPQLSVSQFSGTSYAANKFINSLSSSTKIDLFLFDSTNPNGVYDSGTLSRTKQLIMLSEINNSTYLGSAKDFGTRFKNTNKKNPIHIIDSRQQHVLADDLGFKMYVEYKTRGKLDEKNFINNNLDIVNSIGGAGSNTTSTSSSNGGGSSGTTSTSSSNGGGSSSTTPTSPSNGGGSSSTRPTPPSISGGSSSTVQTTSTPSNTGTNNNNNNTQNTSQSRSSNWVTEALQKAKEFIKGGNKNSDPEDPGIIDKILEHISEIIKAINNILLVLLAGLSAISLSVVGIRYIASGASPEQKRAAIDNLHTVFKGMLIGFGAFMIWRLAMGLVDIILSSF